MQTTSETAEIVFRPRTDASHKYPFRMSPFFIIEHCRNCKEHQWCTRHDEE